MTADTNVYRERVLEATTDLMADPAQLDAIEALAGIAWPKVQAEIKEEMGRRCPFCLIARFDPNRQVLTRPGGFYRGCIVIEPLRPVSPGHRLVIPVEHVVDARADRLIAARAMETAADVAADIGECNIITSCGHAATQTVFHMHIHVVPRVAGDGLALPWSVVPLGDQDAPSTGGDAT